MFLLETITICQLSIGPEREPKDYQLKLPQSTNEVPCKQPPHSTTCHKTPGILRCTFCLTDRVVHLSVHCFQYHCCIHFHNSSYQNPQDQQSHHPLLFFHLLLFFVLATLPS